MSSCTVELAYTLLKFGLLSFIVGHKWLYLLQEHKGQSQHTLVVEVALKVIGPLDEIKVQMDVNLWLPIISYKRRVICDQLVNEITQEQDHALILVLLLVDFINQLLVLP